MSDALVSAADGRRARDAARAGGDHRRRGWTTLVAWAGGDAAAAERLRKLEHRADKHKRELREALTEAFSTPLEPEDIFELSTGLDEVINSAKNIVGEAEAMQTEPDAATAEMATQLLDGTKRLARGARAVRGRRPRGRDRRRRPRRQGPAPPPAQLPRAMSALVERPGPARDRCPPRAVPAPGENRRRTGQGRRAGLVLGAEGKLTLTRRLWPCLPTGRRRRDDTLPAQASRYPAPSSGRVHRNG